MAIDVVTPPEFVLPIGDGGVDLTGGCVEVAVESEVVELTPPLEGGTDGGTPADFCGGLRCGKLGRVGGCTLDVVALLLLPVDVDDGVVRVGGTVGGVLLGSEEGALLVVELVVEVVVLLVLDPRPCLFLRISSIMGFPVGTLYNMLIVRFDS